MNFHGKMWMIITVETGIEWPDEEISVECMGRSLLLRPPEGNSAADVRIQYNHPEQERETFEFICRFLSGLSWWYKRPVKTGLKICCTAPMRGRKRDCVSPLQRNFHASTLTLPDNKKTRLALALYRESKCVQSTPYEFLGYFKIINILYSDGKEQITWINKTIPKLKDTDVNTRIEELKAIHNNLGEYLYRSGRCAVAHASVDPIIDPDNPIDILRLSADTPIAQALAEYLIEFELGLKWMYSEL
jgi:methylamine utilization protein MauJ